MKTIYVANDGEQFENEKECIEYEKKVGEKYNLSNALILNPKGEHLKARNRLECHNALEWAHYILVKSEKDYNKIKAICEELGFGDDFPVYNKKYEGHETIFAYEYMTDEGQWVNLDDFLLKVKEDIAEIKSFVEKAKQKNDKNEC